MVIVGKTYSIDDVIMMCTKVRESGCNTFQIIENNKNPLIIRHVKLKGVVLDYGIRIIYNRVNELKEIL